MRAEKLVEAITTTKEERDLAFALLDADGSAPKRMLDAIQRYAVERMNASERRALLPDVRGLVCVLEMLQLDSGRYCSCGGTRPDDHAEHCGEPEGR